jgi:hypothetical protein
VPLVRGSARFADEDPRDLILCAGGAGFAERGDDGFFLHQKAGGACRLTARIAELAGGGAGARIGLACRESLAAGSRFAGIFLSGGTGGRRLEFGSRAPALAFTGGGEEPSPDAGWLRLERRGDRVRGLASADGVAWTPLGEVEIAALPTTLLLGIAAAGGDADPAASFEAFSARIAAVELLPLASQSTFRRGDASGDGKVDVTDCLRILNHLFRGGPAPACGDAADGNDSGAVDVSDAIAIFDFLFHGTRPDLPPPGHASCGDDPTADALGCAGFQEGCGE